MKSEPVYYLLNRRTMAKADKGAIRLRVVMFGFAGGSVTALVALAEELPSWVEVWGAEYPGRGIRWQSSLVRTFDLLAADLAPGLSAFDDTPLVLFGYSMGAQVACRLASARPVPPLGLIIASARPPQQHDRQWLEQDLSDAVLLRRLQALGGIPAKVLSNRPLCERFVAVARADLALCADMSHGPVKALPCPVLALCGDEDPVLRETPMPRWLALATGEAELSACRAYPGGHFFHKGIEATVAFDIELWLSAFLRSAEVPAAPMAGALLQAELQPYLGLQRP